MFKKCCCRLLKSCLMGLQTSDDSKMLFSAWLLAMHTDMGALWEWSSLSDEPCDDLGNGLPAKVVCIALPAPHKTVRALLRCLTGWHHLEHLDLMELPAMMRYSCFHFMLCCPIAKPVDAI